MDLSVPAKAIRLLRGRRSSGYDPALMRSEASKALRGRGRSKKHPMTKTFIAIIACLGQQLGKSLHVLACQSRKLLSNFTIQPKRIEHPNRRVRTTAV